MKTIDYTSPFVPAELIAAHGFAPRWLRLRGTDDPLPAGAIQGVCPFVRAFVGHVLADAVADAVVLTTTCDQMRQAATIVGRATTEGRSAGCPVFLLNVPSTWQTPAARQLYLDELQRLARFLVDLGGKSPSNGEFAEVMFKYDTVRQQRRTQPMLPPPAGRRGTTSSFHPPGGIPLAILGGPLLENDRAILDLVERSGGRVVLDATEGGERSLPAAFDRGPARDDPLAELARAYFSIPDAFRRPNEKLYQWLSAEISGRQIRGIILWRYLWCDLWHAELSRLKESSPVPVLDLEASDGKNGSLGRTWSRIEAFLEMLR